MSNTPINNVPQLQQQGAQPYNHALGNLDAFGIAMGVGGTVTVPYPTLKAGAHIQATWAPGAAAAGVLQVTTQTVDTEFIVTSTVAGDAGKNVSILLVNPNG